MAALALKPFVRQWTVLLTTYRRDGTPVGTPVNIAVAHFSVNAAIIE